MICIIDPNIFSVGLSINYEENTFIITVVPGSLAEYFSCLKFVLAHSFDGLSLLLAAPFF